MLALTILVAGLAAYANGFTGLFVFDDEPAIARNLHITHLWPLTAAMRAPEGTTASGRPVVGLTLALNYALSPADARDAFTLAGPNITGSDRNRLDANLWGYHALNLAIHLATALALFGVLCRTMSSEPLRDRVGASARGLALATALVWTVHPLQTGAVTYVIQRAESLMGLFLVLTLYCAIRAWNESRWWMALAAATCALGMASKETMVVAPLVVVLWDWIFAKRSLRTRGSAGSSQRMWRACGTGRVPSRWRSVPPSSRDDMMWSRSTRSRRPTRRSTASMRRSPSPPRRSRWRRRASRLSCRSWNSAWRSIARAVPFANVRRGGRGGGYGDRHCLRPT